MKARRIVLVVDEPDNLPALRVVLETNHYRVITRSIEEPAVPVVADVQLLGPNVRYPEEPQPQPVLQMSKTWTMRQTLEMLRVALIRKRGPKKGVKHEGS